MGQPLMDIERKSEVQKDFNRLVNLTVHRHVTAVKAHLQLQRAELFLLIFNYFLLML